MSASGDARRAMKERDQLMRDAYYGRNGLSMSESQREDYKAMMDRVKLAWRISRGR